MLETQKTEIFQILQNSGLKLEDFHFEETLVSHPNSEVMPTLKITHHYTPLKLLVRNSCESCTDFYVRYTSFTPDFSWIDCTPSDCWNSFDEVLKTIAEWVEDEIKAYISANGADDPGRNLRRAGSR